MGDRIDFGRNVLRDEARALDALADSLGEEFDRAVDMILGAGGKLIVSGLGKSGHIGRKIAATFASTGTTATFLHLAEAIHGDLGIATPGDIAILISQSGQTAELAPAWSATAGALGFEPIITVYLQSPGSALSSPMLALRLSVTAVAFTARGATAPASA